MAPQLGRDFAVGLDSIVAVLVAVSDCPAFFLHGSVGIQSKSNRCLQIIHIAALQLARKQKPHRCMNAQNLRVALVLLPESLWYRIVRSGGLVVPSKDWILPTPAESAIFRALPEGGVLFSTASEVYFGVNMVGARIWALLPPVSRSYEELCSTLCSEYSDVGAEVIRADARKFLEQLLSNGLVVALPPSGAVSDAPRA